MTWGKLLARSFPHTPFKKLSNKNHLNKFVRFRIDSRRAPQDRALAIANSQGPPRPCLLGELFGIDAGRRGGRPAFNNKSKTKPLYVILSEVELSPSEERGESKAQGATGISLGISVTFHRNVTFALVSHQDSLRDPFVAFAPRFCLFAKAQPAELRLRKTQAFSSAQDDIQRRAHFIFLTILSFFDMIKVENKFFQVF